MIEKFQTYPTTEPVVSGENKDATVLFADIVDSLRIIIDREPEEAQSLMKEVTDLLLEIVVAYDGAKIQTQGDGVMACFGVPVACEDHAIRAAYAALAMQDAIEQRREEYSNRYGAEVRIRVGMDSGAVVYHVSDTGVGTELAVAGRPSHMAHRMLEFAVPGQACLTADARRYAGEMIKVEELGVHDIKGLDESIPIYGLTDVNTARSRFQIAQARGMHHQFVGRFKELSELNSAFEAVEKGFGCMVTISGAPGMGKSRLLHEFARTSSIIEVPVHITEAVPYTANNAYLPVRQLLRSMCGISDNMSREDTVENLRVHLEANGLTQESDLPAIASVVDLDFVASSFSPMFGTAWDTLDSSQRRRKSVESIVRLIQAHSDERPLILGFEDIQWFDDQSLAVFRRLAEAMASRQLLLVATCRDDHRVDWPASVLHRHIALGPLPEESALRLLDQMLGDHHSLSQLKQLLLERTGGTPLFIEETVLSMVEEHMLDGVQGEFRFIQPDYQLDTPDTVKGVLRTRKDRLPAPSKRVLETASVIGRYVPFKLLQEVAHLSISDLRMHVRTLCTRGFLQSETPNEDSDLSFKHLFTRDVAYNDLLKRTRQNMHADTVHAIERIYADRLQENVEQLAYHSARGNLGEKALDYHLQACIRAVSRFANREALDILDAGLKIAEQLPSDARHLKTAIDLRLNAVGALVARGEIKRHIVVLREAEDIATEVQDDRRLAKVNCQLSVVLWQTGQYEAAIAKARRALAITRADLPIRLSARFGMGMSFHAQGRFREAMDVFAAIVADLSGPLEIKRLGWVGYPSVFARVFLASSAKNLGQYSLANRHFARALRVAEELKHPYSLALTLDSYGALYLAMNRTREAVRTFERCLRICYEGEVHNMIPVVYARLARAYVRQRRYADAQDLIRAAVTERIQKRAGLYARFYMAQAESEFHLARRRPLQALATARAAVELTRHNGEYAHLAYCLRLVAEALAQLGTKRHAWAKQFFLQALACASSRGMQPLITDCRLGLEALRGRKISLPGTSIFRLSADVKRAKRFTKRPFQCVH